jgi:hypothetical protein
MVPKAGSSYVKELVTKKQKDSKKASFYNGVVRVLTQDAPYRETGYKFTW